MEHLIESVNKNSFPVDPIRKGLEEFTETINMQMERIESVFLHLGQDIQQIYSDSDQLTQTIAQSAEAIGSSSDGGFTYNIHTIVTNLINQLRHYSDILGSNTEQMEKGSGELETLCRICNELDKITRFLNIVGMNIDVESCRSTESRNMFEGFGGEVKELSSRIGVIADNIFKDSKSVQTTHMKGIHKIRNNLQKLSEYSSSAEEGVQHAVEKMDKLTAISYATLDNAAIHSKDIQKKIGEVVMSIQFHDIIRQKLEHVLSAFDDCRDLAENLAGDNGSNPYQHDYDRDRINGDSGRESDGPKDVPSEEEQIKSKQLQRNQASIYFMLKLQAAQLQKIVSELDTVHSDISRSFKWIGEKTANMIKEVIGSDIDRKKRDTLESEFEAIGRELENLNNLRNQARSMSKDIMGSIQETSSIISGLSGYTDQVRSINVNLQYKALNAIIMTGRLGEKGRTLEVLAREVRSISVSSNELMEKILDALKNATEITDSLQKLDDEVYEGTADKGKNIDNGGGELDQIMYELHETLDRYRSGAAESVALSNNFGKNIETMAQRVNFIKQWARDIESIHEKLEEIVLTLQPMVLAFDKNILIEFENIEKRYTMESEREVHHRISGAADIENEGIGDETAADDPSGNPDDEFDDNVELF